MGLKHGNTKKIRKLVKTLKYSEFLISQVRNSVLVLFSATILTAKQKHERFTLVVLTTTSELFRSLENTSYMYTS